MKRSLFLLFISAALSSFVLPDEGTYPTTLTGKKVSETLFGDYIKEELSGDQMIIVVGYGCDHCRDATKEITQLKKENLLSDIIVLGTGGETDKDDFRKETATNYKMVDYDFESMKQKIKAFDSNFPPPPFAIWVKDNVIKAVFVKMPSVKEFRKIQDTSR